MPRSPLILLVRRYCWGPGGWQEVSCRVCRTCSQGWEVKHCSQQRLSPAKLVALGWHWLPPSARAHKLKCLRVAGRFFKKSAVRSWEIMTSLRPQLPEEPWISVEQMSVEGLNESFHFTSQWSAALQMEKDRIWGSAYSLLKQYS